NFSLISLIVLLSAALVLTRSILRMFVHSMNDLNRVHCNTRMLQNNSGISIRGDSIPYVPNWTRPCSPPWPERSYPQHSCLTSLHPGLLFGLPAYHPVQENGCSQELCCSTRDGDTSD